MGRLIPAVAAICLILGAQALPDNIEDVKVLEKLNDPVLEAEETSPQARKERCTTCGKDNVLAALQNLPPGTEVHTQSSFEGCSSDKGCAGIKVKDGRVLEKFGNIDAFRAAAEADTGNEFSYHAAGTFGNGVFQGGIPKDGPFWWMNENSPFKAAGGASGGNFEKYSQSSSSSFSSNGGAAGNAGAGNGGAGFSASLDLSGNPFLNGDFSKLATGFTGGANRFAQGQESSSSFSKPGGGNYQSSFESSSYSTSSKNGGEVDISKNPYLNGGFRNQAGFQGAFGATGASGSNFQSSQASNKFGAGYVGSSPQPFTAPTSGINVNLIQNTQKASEFDYEQQQQGQQNIDEIFQGTGNVHAHEHSAGELQQTCAGQGYVCVHKAQCNNGVVNTNGAGILQAQTKKQYCNIKSEICCRIEISTLQGAGGLQGSLGVGQATYNGGRGSQGGGLFVSTSEGSQGNLNSQGSQGGSNSFGQSGSAFGSESSGSSSRGSSSSSFDIESSSSRGSGSGTFGNRGNAFGAEAGQRGQAGSGFGGQGGYGTQTSTFESSSSTFGSNSNRGTAGNGFGNQGANGNNANGFNAQGSSSFGQTGSAFSAQGGQGGQNTGFGANTGNRGVTVGTSSFESSTTRGTNFGGNGGKFGATGGFGNTGSSSTGIGTTNFGITGGSNAFGTTNKFGGSFDNNEVLVKGTTTNTQTNFVETDTFSSGSDSNGVYRPGASGSGLEPGIPYFLPPDNSNAGTNFVTATSAFSSTTPRPVYTTPRPTYLPPSTSAPRYLPPVGEQSINTETRVPVPTYNTGGILLDESRTTPRPLSPVPINNNIPSGCAAALKCTPVEYCTAEGVMSKSLVVLTRDQEAFRVPLTDCKNLETGEVGKCCRDPDYTDPWPTNLIGKWTQGVFGGNDGKYVPDSRGSPSISSSIVTARPPVTGSVFLNNFRSTTKPTLPPFGPNQVTPGFPSVTTSSFAQKEQFEIRKEGQYAKGGQGQYGQGGQGQYAQTGQSQYAQASQGQYGQGGQGQYGQGGQGQYLQGGVGQIGIGAVGQVGQGGQQTNQFTTTQTQQTQYQSQNQNQRGQGQFVTQGQGQLVTQGGGAYQQGGKGQFGIGGLGQIEIQEQNAQSQFAGIQGQANRGQSQATNSRGQGQIISQGQGQFVTQGQGTGIRQGGGVAVSQGAGFGVENEYSESVQRVFLQQYSAGGQCGQLNGQKPYGNRNELEVDFAEIPWQAMVLLQTNRSLLCGGVITRPDVVITTASCVEGLQAKNVLIKGGEWKLGIDDEPLPFQIVQVKNILRHPFYKRGSYQYDAAILVLNENLRLAKNIYPICLPGAQDTLDGFYNGAGECLVTGWGRQVLQAHLAGSLLHSLNISLINPGECQAKLSQDYPHLLEQYDENSCACGQPTNPINNICKVDTGSALACTTGDGHFVLRGVYSWDSGCQPGNQLAAFYKFDLEWYEWAIGLIESARFAQYSSSSQSSRSQFSGQIKGVPGQQFSGIKSGAKGGQGFTSTASATAGFGGFNQGGQYSQFSSKFSGSSSDQGSLPPLGTKPIQNSFSATYSEKKFYQSEPKIVTFTTKPEYVTFTTKPELFTYTTKPKIVTYTTKPQIITYETSGSGDNPQYVAPGVTYNPGFGELVGKQHNHNAQCKCLEQGKK